MADGIPETMQVRTFLGEGNIEFVEKTVPPAGRSLVNPRIFGRFLRSLGVRRLLLYPDL